MGNWETSGGLEEIAVSGKNREPPLTTGDFERIGSIIICGRSEKVRQGEHVGSARIGELGGSGDLGDRNTCKMGGGRQVSRK